MGDEAFGDVTHAERRELDALRRRAYGPDADIFDDPVSLARLSELEDRVLAANSPAGAEPPPWSAVTEAATAPDEPVVPSPSPVDPADPAARTPRWHRALLAGTAGIALLLGGAAWTASRTGPAEDLPSADAKTLAVAQERRAASYEVGYEMYLDGLRDEVLGLAADDPRGHRMIYDQLVPYGSLYGRTVGAGPTVDHEFCMIIADLPQPSITCIPVENAYANPVSVLLPSWYSDADSDLFTGLGPLVTYTLLPGGSVVAEYASPDIGPGTDDATGTDDVTAPGAAPTPTAVPPPGWQ